MPKFIFWDVQHGAACHIRDDENRNIIVDLGNGISRDGSYFSPVDILRAQGVLDELHLLIVTHPHEDHIADLPSLKGVPIRRVIAPENIPESLFPTDDSELTIQYKRLVAAHQFAPPFPLRTPTKESWKGLKMSVFRPTCRTNNLNDYSLVVLLEYEGFGILLCGDNERNSWESLLNQESFVSILRKVQIFVASHHGRESGFFPPLFEKLRPKLTIVSDGPVMETDVASRYAAISKGMEVRYKDGGTEKRKCITTRCDGSILIEIEAGFFNPDVRVTVEKGAGMNTVRKI